MAKSDIAWATGDAWDVPARESFEAELKKTRAPKRQRALTCKASALEAGRDDEKIRAAIDLHTRALAEVQKGSKEERFGATLRLAQAHLRAGNDADAEPLLRTVIKLVPLSHRAQGDIEWLPETALARLLERNGRIEESDTAWSALEAFMHTRPHALLPESIASMQKRSLKGVDGAPYAGLDDAAEHFAVNHHMRRGLVDLFDANRASLEALDTDIRFEPLAWAPNRVGPARDATRAVHELGGYFARVAARVAQATLIDAVPLGLSRILVAGETRDPFAAAWRVVIRGARATASFDALVAR